MGEGENPSQSWALRRCERAWSTESPALDATRTGVANRNPEWTGDGTFVLYVMARAASDDSGYAAEGLWATRVEPSLGTPVNISNTNRDCAAQEGWPPSTCPEVGYTSWVQP